MRRSSDRPWATSGSLTSGPPAGGFELLQHPMVLAIAARLDKTAAQVVLRWHSQRGVSTVPKSVTPARIASNIQIFDFELSADDLRVFDAFNCGWRHLLWPETAIHPDYPSLKTHTHTTLRQRKRTHTCRAPETCLLCFSKPTPRSFKDDLPSGYVPTAPEAGSTRADDRA